MSTTPKLPDLFGSMVFNEETMKERLSSASYSAWKKCITDGTSLDLATAHEIDVPLPLTAQLFEIQQALKVSGHMDDDHAGYVQYFEQLAGVTVHSDET